MALLAGGIAALNASASPVVPPPPELYPLSAVALSPDGSRLAVGLPPGGVWGHAEPKGRIVVWDAAEGTHLQTLEGHEEDVTALAFSP
ncbi:MAG: WD40 repeat domain-containing protein, partial [Candidatus Hydrogenedentota bacterium]